MNFWTKISKMGNVGSVPTPEQPANSPPSPSKLTQRPPDHDMHKLNESVWELQPTSGVPQVEVIFFHGLQFDNSDEAFWKTWLSRDETVVWPKTWLAERLPGARILFVSYNSSLRKISQNMDLYAIVENLRHDLILSNCCGAGQHSPVILVGHSFGGIVIKKFLVECTRSQKQMASHRQANQIETFVKNCKGVFYYSTPHAGTKVLVDYAEAMSGRNHPLVSLLKILCKETGRLNGSFRKIRTKYGISTAAIVENLPTLLGTRRELVVTDASAREDIDGDIFTANSADHITVCRAENNEACSIFNNLLEFINDAVTEKNAEVLEGLSL